jgi:predicted neutral ceramidase superfamily lipid hydrolase
LCVTHDEIDRIVDAIDEAVGEVEAEASLVT